MKWTNGENAFGRVGVVMLAAIAATLFAFLNIALAFTALMAFVGCLLLLVVGVFFACLWIIPGRPRQWGLNWFEALIGLVLQSFLAMLVFGTALTLVTAVFSLSGSLGWLPVSGLAIAVLIAGFRLRRLLDNLTTMMRPGAGSIMLGGLARRGATGAVRRLLGALGSRGAAPALAERSRTRNIPSEAGTQRVSSVRVYRQAPAAGALARGGAGSSPYELTTGSDRRKADAGAGPAGGAGAGQRATGEAGRGSSSGPARSTSALNLARARTQSRTEGRRTISVSAASAPVTASGSSAKASSADAPKGRHARGPQPSSANDVRYEPRPHVQSASLREGPPKAPRVRRRSPGQQQRRFREYSSFTKDGVTVHVPTRR